jgi:hypothetical protein
MAWALGFMKNRSKPQKSRRKFTYNYEKRVETKNYFYCCPLLSYFGIIGIGSNQDGNALICFIAK